MGIDRTNPGTEEGHKIALFWLSFKSDFMVGCGCYLGVVFRLDINCEFLVSYRCGWEQSCLLVS